MFFDIERKVVYMSGLLQRLLILLAAVGGLVVVVNWRVVSSWLVDLHELERSIVFAVGFATIFLLLAWLARRSGAGRKWS